MKLEQETAHEWILDYVTSEMERQGTRLGQYLINRMSWYVPACNDSLIFYEPDNAVAVQLFFETYVQ